MLWIMRFGLILDGKEIDNLKGKINRDYMELATIIYLVPQISPLFHPLYAPLELISFKILFLPALGPYHVVS